MSAVYGIHSLQKFQVSTACEETACVDMAGGCSIQNSVVLKLLSPKWFGGVAAKQMRQFERMQARLHYKHWANMPINNQHGN